MTAALAADGLGLRYGRTWALADCTLDIPTVSIHLETGCGELAVRVSLAPSAQRSAASA